jgi:enamine deaminase RidA (YjgF/YER057c/UK114 family)
MAVQLFNPEGIAEAPGVSLVAVGTGSRLIAVAGQTGRDLEGNFADGLAAQFTKALANLGVALASAGASSSDVPKVTVFVAVNRDSCVGRLVRVDPDRDGHEFSSKFNG